ncbi:MAG: YigZ family protein [Bacteroidales bacterium]|jgi:uncharacterized YigZ family protein|nr:YigZ family protein [Bacteroidales bacterium]
MNDTYLTIASPSSGIYKEKGSKFIALAYPVENEEEVKQRLAEVKKKYFDARHHCYAYALGYGRQTIRMNDDGEPSSSAGKPIYGQLISKDLTDVLVVVVRYFGGVKLGVGGLIQAYKTATADCLESAPVVERIVEDKFMVAFDYAAMNAVMKVFKEHNITTKSHNFDTKCSLEFSVRRTLSDTLRKKISSIPNTEIKPL